MRDEPWFIIGDLNEITGNHEKQGGVLRHADTFLQFNNMIENCGLMEFPSLGNTLSWNGRRAGHVLSVNWIGHWQTMNGIICFHVLM